jgi:type II secretory pathway pseudopilin PulG
MHNRHAAIFNPGRSKQRGVALMVMLVIIIVGSAAFLVSSLIRSGLQIERDQKTSEALAQAKEALIGYTASVDLTTSARPGDLPCPDTNNDGIQETSCGNASGSTGQALRIGRLPWKTLGLPDLRDGSGERLWYAVSNNFKYNTRTTCTNSNLTGCLNSDTPGTITVFASDGTLLNDGGASTGAVAVIIAPGDVLTRTDQTIAQDRSSAGINNSQNYLDIALGEDNTNFTDSSSTNGFIQGRIKDNSGNVILNDQLLIITQDNIMLPIQKRVAAEVKNCLIEYAAIPQNNNYYPWAATRTGTSPVTYPDTSDLEFGRVPDVFFEQTCNDTGGSNCDHTYESGGMTNSWGATCTLTISNWWVNWKEMVFYGMAHYQRPHNLSHTHNCTTDACLVVNPPSAATDKQFVVIVAGKKIGAQVRSSAANKSNLNNYLEGGNAIGATPFEQNPLSTTFNDAVVFQ